MALAHDEIVRLLNDIPANSYKAELSNKPVSLSPEMAAALGQSKRTLVRVLATVVDAIANKLFVKSIVVNDSNVQTAVDQWLAVNEWDLLERNLYNYAVRDGKSYALVSFANNQPRINALEAFDGKTGVYVVTDEMNPDVQLFAINTWYAGGDRFLDAYYPDRIEKYIYDGNEWGKRRDTPDEAWPIDWSDVNNAPLGIPLIEYSIGESDLANGAVQVQKDINEALVDLLAVNRMMGFPQRYIKGKNTMLITNDLGKPLISPLTGEPFIRKEVLSPGAIKLLNAGDDFGQLDAATPNTSTLDMLLEVLALVTTVPSHYFKGDWPSGVALLQAESRLNSLAEAHQSQLTSPVIRMIGYMVKLANTFGRTTYNTAYTIDVTWHSPQVLTYDLQMQLEESKVKQVTALRTAGLLSLQAAVRMLHPDWDETQIAAEIDALNAEQAAGSAAVLSQL